MARWAMELGLVGWCVLCSAGCRKPEPKTQHAVPAATQATAASEDPPASPPVRTVEVVELPEQAASPTETRGAEPPPEHTSPRTASEADEEQPPSRLLETDAGSWERAEHLAARASPRGDDKAWFREAAEAARAGNTRISATEPVEAVTIATGTVDGRVRRVRPGAIEVGDNEGNIYELRIDGRSRGLRRGRHIPLKDITEGTPVRASFDLVGGGESLARDIVLQR